MRAVGAGRTDKGLVRDHNEDALLVDNANSLFVVCDGMGGHEGGEVASATAIQAVKDAVLADEGHDLEGVVERAALAACAEVFRKSMTDEGKPGMGCTLTMVLVRDGQAVMGHVGDSRLYWGRGERFRQVSQDHTWVQQRIDAGKMTREEAEAHPKAHALVNAVGLHEDCDVDTAIVAVEAGDRLVICSDGLANYLTETEPLPTLMQEQWPQAAADDAVDWVKKGECADNVTVVVVDIKEVRLDWPKLDPELLGDWKQVTFEAGDVLVERESAYGAWYVVEAGELAIRRWSRDLRVLGPGESVGASALVAPHQAQGDLVATKAGSARLMDAVALGKLKAGKKAGVLEMVARHLAETAALLGHTEP